MRRFPASRPLTPLLVAVTGGSLLLVCHAALTGRSADDGPVTWSGRIRVERTLTMEKHCTNCDWDVHDFELSALFVTEYDVEGIGQVGPGQWMDAGVPVRVRGNQHSRSHGVNNRPEESNLDSLIDWQVDGSGRTTAGVTVFVRQAGESDVGHCRLEFGPVGQRDDGGPLTKSPELPGTKRERFRYKERPTHDATKPESLTVEPDGGRFEVPCPIGARALHGDRVVREGKGNRVRVSWDLVQDGEARTEVVLVPASGYDEWLPQAGETEAAVGDFVDVRVVARERGKPGSKPPVEVRRFEVKLVDVSREPGVSMNWPAASVAKNGPDLKVDRDNPYIRLLDDDGQSAETKKAGLTEFMVTVNSHDWGAFGKLQVTAELEDGTTVPAHVEGRPSEYALALPKDENSNHVADWWEHWFELKGTAPESDDDATPLGDGHEGDGISLYQEYRGFHEQGRHQRLSPELKDLFVHDRDGLGLGTFGETGLQLHRVSRSEVTMVAGDGNNWTADGNRASHSNDKVWALRMVRFAIGEGAVGETEGGPGVPARITEVRIDSARIAAAAGPYAASELKSTIAHELGHAVNLWHHGDGLDYAVAGDVLLRRKDGTTKNFVCPSTGCFLVAVQHGAYSGDDRCVLRYNSTDFYEDPGGNCEWRVGAGVVRGRRYGYDAPGTLFCETGKGSGVNDTSKPPNKAGDAMAGRGSCLFKLCVRSDRH